MTDPFATPPPGSPAPLPPAPPLYGEQLPVGRRNGFGTAALVLGVVSLVLFVFIFPPVLALVFGFLGRARAKRGEATNKGSATAGIVLGLIGLALAAVAITGIVALFNSPEWDRFNTCNDAAVTSEEQKACITQLSHDLRTR